LKHAVAAHLGVADRADVTEASGSVTVGSDNEDVV